MFFAHSLKRHLSNLSDKPEDTIRIIRDICFMGTHRAYLFLKVNQLKIKKYTKLFPLTITPGSIVKTTPSSI